MSSVLLITMARFVALAPPLIYSAPLLGSTASNSAARETQRDLLSAAVRTNAGIVGKDAKTRIGTHPDACDVPAVPSVSSAETLFHGDVRRDTLRPIARATSPT